MSLEVSTFYWDRCPEVTGSARLVILALADRCNEDGWCYPSVPELARRCRLSDRGVQKLLARLAAGGHIAVEAKEGARKTHGSPTHRYHLLAYQRSQAAGSLTAGSLTAGSLTAGSLGGAKGEPARSPFVDKGEPASSPFGVAKGEPTCSPFVVEKGEPARSPFAPAKGEQIDGKGEQASSPEPYRTNSDPNTRAEAAAVPADYQKVVTAYHNAIGVLTPIVEEEIKAELTRSPLDWVLRAIEIAAMRNHRRWAYVAGILRRWHADGYDGGPDKQAGKPRSNTSTKSMGYGRPAAPPVQRKGQSIEDYADDPEYYAQLKAIYAGGAVTPSAAD